MTLITAFICPPTIYFKFITKWDSFFFFFTKCDGLLLQSATAFLLQSATSVITKCDRYYKMRRLLQSATVHTYISGFLVTLNVSVLKLVHDALTDTTYVRWKSKCVNELCFTLSVIQLSSLLLLIPSSILSLIRHSCHHHHYHNLNKAQAPLISQPEMLIPIFVSNLSPQNYLRQDGGVYQRLRARMREGPRPRG